MVVPRSKLFPWLDIQTLSTTHGSLLIGWSLFCFSYLFHLSFRSIQSQSIFLSKGKPCKISSFKGNSAQYDESGNRTNNSNASKNSVQLSYAAQEREETIIESPDVQKDPLSNMSEEKEEETITGSPAIRQLFKKWLIVLRTPTSTQPTEKIFEESLPQTEVSEQQNGNRQLGAAGQLMKAALGYFLGLDATIKFPTIIL